MGGKDISNLLDILEDVVYTNDYTKLYKLKEKIKAEILKQD